MRASRDEWNRITVTDHTMPHKSLPQKMTSTSFAPVACVLKCVEEEGMKGGTTTRDTKLERFFIDFSASECHVISGLNSNSVFFSFFHSPLKKGRSFAN